MGNHKQMKTHSWFLLTEMRAVLGDVIHGCCLQKLQNVGFLLLGCWSPACCVHSRLMDVAAAFPFAGTGHQWGWLCRWPQTKCCLQQCRLCVELTEALGRDQLFLLDLCKQIICTCTVWGRSRLSPSPAASPRHTGCDPQSHSSHRSWAPRSPHPCWSPQ